MVEMKDEIKCMICPTKVGSGVFLDCVCHSMLAVKEAQDGYSPNLGMMPEVSQEITYSRKHTGSCSILLFIFYFLKFWLKIDVLLRLPVLLVTYSVCISSCFVPAIHVWQYASSKIPNCQFLLEYVVPWWY